MSYARAGARVVAVDLLMAAAERTVQAITGEGGMAVPFTADATDPTSVKEAVASATLSARSTYCTTTSALGS
jgi:NAD(P)-dependent dehydrogenase (short-subunit alcohol dehydrogenase family)